MNKFIHILYLTLLANIIFAQEPHWYDSNNRELYFPQSEYFIGFYEESYTSQEERSSLIKRVYEFAEDQLARTIIKHHNSTTLYKLSTYKLDSADVFNITSSRNLLSEINSSTDIDLLGLNKKIWENVDKRTIAAFVYIKKDIFIAKVQNIISVNTQTILNMLDHVDLLLNNGLRKEAQNEYDNSKLKIITLYEKSIRYYLMQCLIDDNINSLDIKQQFQQFNSIYNKNINLQAELTKGTSIYLHCDTIYNDSLPLHNYPLTGIVAKELSENGYNLVDSISQSDYGIYIQSKLLDIKINQQMDMKEFYAKVKYDVTIFNNKTSNRIYIGSMTEKVGVMSGVVDSFDKVNRSASHKIVEIVKKHIE